MINLVLLSGVVLNSLSPVRPPKLRDYADWSMLRWIEVRLGAPVQEVKGYRWTKPDGKRWTKMAFLPGISIITLHLPGGKSYTLVGRGLVMRSDYGRVSDVSYVPCECDWGKAYAAAVQEAQGLGKRFGLPAEYRKEIANWLKDPPNQRVTEHPDRAILAELEGYTVWMRMCYHSRQQYWRIYMDFTVRPLNASPTE